jgi:spore germination protein YaaH
MLSSSSTYTRSIIMAMDKEALKNAIEEKALKSPKPQLYVKDFYKCDPDSKPRVIKNVANEMVREGRLMFWSSGSTTMYAVPSRIKNEEGGEGMGDD